MNNRINFIIDALMFLVMMGIAGIGFLMNWVLLPGREAALVHGGHVDLTFLGIDRHQWGDVHLVLGLVLLALLVLHVVLHWKQILHLLCKLLPNRPVRLTVAIVFLAVCAVLVAFPVLVRPRVEPAEGGGGHYRQQTSSPGAGKGEGRGGGRGDGSGKGRGQGR